MPLQELVVTMEALEISIVEGSVRRSYQILEVLVLINHSRSHDTPDLMPVTGGKLADRSYFSKLTHLDLQVPLADGSLEFLSSILPRLNLDHFGCNGKTDSLLLHVNLASMKSLSVDEYRYGTFMSLKKAI
ncbi:MAG: hypothetical protein JOS17DRAFT_793992 [Linnemannia elongata]|nr:MAG: hypothetical protein JOS17DRAFT_793992 [Linnemannia elongata]